MTRAAGTLARAIAPVAAVVVLAAALSGCVRNLSAPEYLDKLDVVYPKPSEFTVCHGYDCTFRSPVRLDAVTWARMRAIFTPASASAADEREQIVRAVSLFERAVGTRIGTTNDIGGLGGILAGDPGQLDCIDESVNTTVYLILLADAGLLRWHVPATPAFRGTFFDLRWYHQTAVLMEKATGREYALDTWFRRNGQPGYLVHLSDWQWGYGRPSYSLTPLVRGREI